MLTVVPMTVCGREKRHSASSRPACRPRDGDRDAVHRAAAQPRAQRERDPDRHEHRARERAEHEAPGEHEPLAAAPIGARRSSVAPASASGDGPAARLAAADRDRVAAAAVAVPVRRDRDELDVLEARPLEPLAVLVLGREQHPQLGERAQDAVAGRHRPDHQRHAAGRQHAVGLGDPALGRGPVLDRAGRDVAVEVVGRQRQRLGVAEHLRARARAPACARRGAAGAGSGRASSRSRRRRARRSPRS